MSTSARQNVWRSTLRLIVCALFFFSLAAVADEGTHTRRFGLFIGNNVGGDGTRPLFYARDDAQRLADVFARIGGLRAEDSMVLLDQNATDVEIALGELDARVKRAHSQGDRTIVFFYYSGHATDGALRLGTTKLALESVKARLASSTGDVRIAIFDACRSGSVTRTKGVRKVPAFDIETDGARQAKGLVILTSSAGDEDSQESDLIGASYFSYHFATGLLGSADQSHDGRVSLSEAYQYAYDHTVAATADSEAGAQHPTFSFDLAGNGDLPLTDVTNRNEGIAIPAAAPQGPYFLIDQRGVVVAELVKTEAARALAVGPGKYTIKRRLKDHLRIGEIEVRAGQMTTLDESTFKDAPFSDDPVKGTGLSSTFTRHWSISAAGQFQAVFDAPAPIGQLPSAPMIGVEATLHNVLTSGLAVSIDGHYGWASSSVSTALISDIPYKYSIVSFGASILYEFRQETRWVPFAGIRIAFDRLTREFTTGLDPDQYFMTLTPGIAAGLKFRITRSIGVIGRGRLHYVFMNSDPKETRSLGYAELGLMLDYEFRD